ncbi:uncharacterized protein GGS25DRAFT_407673 [Hypoxylon fragiforme]|uniref:uncharacterized protein n=1 Tax=Hypoxylon fragiforme TaxID=63214 RepID=UPI0020C62271|nr:uncharacterized protein GGS25DRAFT_407673 [Hypoxylon fragiforme]KAI2604975.1 hypothetical protein GGS25DRAFT_407673 [Hypoxylon fragiforme]
MAHSQDPDQHKRKRDISDDNGSQAPHADRIPQPPPPQSALINYLSKAHPVKLRLIQGESDTFSDVLALVNEYEGVLSRHESLAANLGAKLAGSRLLKAMEGAFEGSITTTPSQTVFASDPVTWLDIVEFSKANPGEFVLTPTHNGTRCCQFPLKGVQVEIGEDDWRLIVSGALDRFKLVPPQPLEEDETAELATLEIVEQRLQVLIKKADEVARRARQLNYHLSGRKASIQARRAASQSTSGPSFQAVNQSIGSGSNPGYDLHADLLQQFLAPSQPSSHRISSVGSVPPTPNAIGTATSTPRASMQQQSLLGSGRPSPGYSTEPGVRDIEEEHRALVTAKIEKLARGDAIQPPCDRCRRLKTQCIKHLTACQGCTKKHARCVWKGLTEEEVTWLKREASGDGGEDVDEPRDLDRSGFGSQFHPDFGDRRRELERGDEVNISRSGSRIAIGRSADDVWRKGPESTSSRHESMELDGRDIRQGQEYARKELPSGVFREHNSMLSHMASVASAAADAAAISRGSQHHSE